VIILKSPREIERMRVPCRIVAEVLALLKDHVKPGVSTCDLEDIALKYTLRQKARPAFKGYCNYPSALCCSPNQQVVHGIPTREPLRDGDVLSLDFGVFFDDFYGDAAVTFPVGHVSSRVSELIAVTEASLYLGIKQAVAGNRLFDISHAVQDYVERNGFSVVRDFVGHGIGRSLHEEPQIPNYGSPSRGVCLKTGMVLAIEPMINEKSHEVQILDDGWTVVTIDGGMSAHFEHTVAITDNGPDILTRLE